MRFVVIKVTFINGSVLEYLRSLPLFNVGFHIPVSSVGPFLNNFLGINLDNDLFDWFFLFCLGGLFPSIFVYKLIWRLIKEVSALWVEPLLVGLVVEGPWASFFLLLLDHFFDQIEVVLCLGDGSGAVEALAKVKAICLSHLLPGQYASEGSLGFYKHQKLSGVVV